MWRSYAIARTGIESVNDKATAVRVRFNFIGSPGLNLKAAGTDVTPVFQSPAKMGVGVVSAQTLLNRRDR